MQSKEVINSVQQSTSKLVKRVLSKNPQLIKSYITNGLSAVEYLLTPANVIMKHLLLVQDLDPNSVPGEKQFKELQQALNNTFSNVHDAAYDDEYDISWVRLKFDETRKKLDQLNLNKESFLKFTDLSLLNDKDTLVNTIAPESEKRELPIMGPSVTPKVNSDKKNKKTSKKLNKTTSKPKKVNRLDVKESVEELDANTSLDVKSGLRTSTKRLPARNLQTIASEKKSKAKEKLESTPEFRAELRARLARAAQVTELMIQNGLCDEKNREEQTVSLSKVNEDALESLERVVLKYKPTKDAISENKFGKLFRRIG